MLLDLGSNKLAAVVFLKDRDSFKTQILTELPSRETDKIEYRLKIFQPGNYEVADPDLETNGRKTTFKCPAVGVGIFEDLFEGGKDVFYWENGELHSCLILD